MRVSMQYGGYATACESFSEGEVEDYTVTILAGSGGALVVQQDDIIKDKATLDIDAAVEKEEAEEEQPVIHGSVNVYPNPAVDQLHVDLGSYAGKETMLTLQNSLGQMIQTHNVTADAIFSLSVKDLQHGYYMLSIQVEGERVITKQVIIGK